MKHVGHLAGLHLGVCRFITYLGSMTGFDPRHWPERRMAGGSRAFRWSAAGSVFIILQNSQHNPLTDHRRKPAKKQLSRQAPSRTEPSIANQRSCGAAMEDAADGVNSPPSRAASPFQTPVPRAASHSLVHFHRCLEMATGDPYCITNVLVCSVTPAGRAKHVFLPPFYQPKLRLTGTLIRSAATGPLLVLIVCRPRSSALTPGPGREKSELGFS